MWLEISNVTLLGSIIIKLLSPVLWKDVPVGTLGILPQSCELEDDISKGVQGLEP